MEDLGFVQKRALIIAGPNGAGKTSFARSFLPFEAKCRRFINADLIAAGLSPFDVERAALKAARLMLAEIQDSCQLGESFSIETTLSGRGYLRQIQDWQSLGYRVSLFYFSLGSEELAIARVAERVRQGGHDIPEMTIRRRFAAGLANFNGPYRALVDDWMAFENSGDAPRVLEWSERGGRGGDWESAGNGDLRAAPGAALRAAGLARELAAKTETAVVVLREGRLEWISADKLRDGASREG